MARAKKEAALTPEERLQAALVPDWEWPYKLPENWCWTRIGMVSNFERGITFPAAAKEAAPTEDNIPCLRTANVQENLEIDDMIYVNRDFMKGNIAKLVRENDIIMSSANSRELVGKSSLVTHIPFPMTFGGFVLNIRAKEMSSKYLFYFLRHEFLAGKFIGESSQTTNIANINTTTLGNYEIPLPPLPEQQRIVDCIESLFAKLDEAKEKAQAVVDSFETRKAAILHKAFTGELTAKWREEHGVGMESWETRELAECFEIVSGIQKTPARSPKDNPVPYLTVANVYRGRIDLSDIRYFEVTSKEIEKLKLQDKDILIVEGNGSGNEIGRCAIWHNELPLCIHQNHIIRMRRKTVDILPEYALHYLNSEAGKSIMRERSKTTAGLFNLSAGKIKTIPLPMASLDEQSEIIYLIDSLLEKEQWAKESAEAVLDQIDLMKKSILARAFRGELGTNDPSEESAVELLKQII
ncbi:Type I restriction enzyme EcoKI specificity protein [Ruminococcus bromii]|nr:restriction endonuclease subunit S [Ruminococcus bromii]PKD30085.1 Type I restriction enzyme EcoKI specificity protein [Ruminococcus bromii]